jgi:cytochrome c553
MIFADRPLKTVSRLAALGLALVSVSAWADGDAERGRIVGDTCRGCHFIPNYKNSYPVYKVPQLGGQNAEYLVAALRGYANGERGHGTMHSNAATLTEQDMQDIAAYLAQFGGPKAGGGGPVSDKVATCTACHGERGISVQAMYPNLAGQHKSYLMKALRDYRSGERRNPIMAGFAASLSDADIEAVSDYFSSQTGLFTPDL